MNSLLITGGTLWTGKTFVRGHALHIEGERIAAVGPEESVRAGAPSERRELRLSGEAVLPGFTDAHLHLTTWAKQKTLLDLGGATSLAEVLELVREEARRIPPDRWIRGWNYNETLWPEGRSVTKDDLDALGIPHPVLLQRVCTHVNAANSRALALVGLDSPDGILEERDAIPALRAMERSVFSREGLREALKSACFELASVGVTCVHPCGADDYGMEEDLSLYDELRRRGELPVRVFTYHDALPYPVMPSGFGDDWIRYQGLKIFLDGSLGGRTAALTAPYADDPAQAGRLNWTDEQVLGMLRAARGKGIQTLLHTIGDKALDQALDCIGKVDEEFGPAALKDRINHLIVCRPEQRRRLAELGLFCDIQPSFIPSDMAMAPLRLGPERMEWTYRWRSILNECGPLSASSDAPVESVNPMHSIWALVERRGKGGGEALAPEERLTVEEALPLFTSNPYKAVGRSDAGRLEAGCLADVVVLDRDLRGLSGDDLFSAGVRCTIAGGRATHGKADARDGL